MDILSNRTYPRTCCLTWTHLLLFKSKKLPALLVNCAVAMCCCIKPLSAIGETGQISQWNFSCQLNATSNEQISADVSIGAADQIKFKINGHPVSGLFLPDSMSHSNSIAFSTTYMSTVFTLVVHIDYFKPYASGYDPSAPPATMAVQYVDAQNVPVVDVYEGSCTTSLSASE